MPLKKKFIVFDVFFQRYGTLGIENTKGVGQCLRKGCE